jgi:hypothetical protein
MRMTALLVALVAVPLAAQDKPAKKPPAPPAPVALTGCVVRAENGRNQYTLRDVETGEMHRLTGLSLRGFVGQRVELLGNTPDSKRLQIKTGLLPNPNIAAQGGAIDPVQAATAAAGGSAPVGDVEFPEFRVKSVKPLSGGCG